MDAKENSILNFLVHPGRYDFKKCKTVNDGSSLSFHEVMKGKYEGQCIIYNFYCPFITPNRPHTQRFAVTALGLNAYRKSIFIVFRAFIYSSFTFFSYHINTTRTYAVIKQAKMVSYQLGVCFLSAKSFEKCNFHIKLAEEK